MSMASPTEKKCYNIYMLYEDIFSALNKKKIHYLVIGGVAVNLHGFPRTTLDLDIMISLAPENRDEFYKLMQQLSFKSKKPALARKLVLGEQLPGKIKVVTFYRDEFELIDVFIQNPIDFETAYKKRKIFRSGKVAISTIPYDTLLAMKRESGRERDLIDVGYLEKIRREKKNGS